MILTIAKKEVVETLRDGRYRWGAGIVFVLLVASLFTGWRNVESEIKERVAAKEGERERWLNQDEKNPHSAAHYGNYAFKPKQVLGALDDGTDPYTGVAVYLEAHRQNQLEYRKAAESTPIQRFGDVTAAVTMQLLIPLLIGLLAFSTFTQERETGTLKLLLSLGVSPEKLMIGKLLGAFTTILFIIVPATLIGAISLLQHSEMPLDGARYRMMVAVYLGFFLAWCALSLAVSAWSKSSRSALVVLLSLWFVQSFVVPRVAIHLADERHPLPSMRAYNDEVRKDIRGGIDGHDPADKRRKELEARLFKEYGVDSLHKLPVNFDAIAMQEGEEYAGRVFDKHFSNLHQRYDEQNQFYQFAGVASPTIAVQMLSMASAGTDGWHHRHFAESAEAHRRFLVRELNMDMAHHSKTGDWQYKAGKALWQKIPDFHYTPPNAVWALSNVMESLVMLLGWLCASMVALYLGVSNLNRMIK
jgi:ABC-2 type transport system permease protein